MHKGKPYLSTLRPERWEKRIAKSLGGMFRSVSVRSSRYPHRDSIREWSVVVLSKLFGISQGVMMSEKARNGPHIKCKKQKETGERPEQFVSRFTSKDLLRRRLYAISRGKKLMPKTSLLTLPRHHIKLKHIDLISSDKMLNRKISA